MTIQPNRPLVGTTPTPSRTAVNGVQLQRQSVGSYRATGLTRLNQSSVGNFVSSNVFHHRQNAKATDQKQLGRGFAAKGSAATASAPSGFAATVSAFRAVVERLTAAVATIGGQPQTASAGSSNGQPAAERQLYPAMQDALLSVAAGQPQLVPNSSPLPYVTGYVATPASAGELVKLGGNNFAIPAWQEEIAAALIRNGGFGNAEQGFLAWSKLGFVRLKNQFLSAEQNQKLAALSLQLGAEVERLPVAGVDSAQAALQTGAAIDSLTSEYDAKLSAFLKDPSQGISLALGKRKFGIQLSEEGFPLSYSYKKQSGWKSFGKQVLGAAGTALALTSGAGLIKLGGTAIFGDTFRDNPLINQLLTQDPQYLTGKLAEQYAQGEVNLRGVLDQYLAAAGTSAQIASVAVPAVRPLAVAGGIAIQAVRSQTQPVNR